MAQRIAIAGFGDTGLLTAIHVGRGFEIVGVSPKPCLVSGQELGMRLTRPDAWKRDYLVDFERYRRLDGAGILQGHITAIDSANQSMAVRLANGDEIEQRWDALVIASGVTNGFWRHNALQDIDAVHMEIERASRQLLAAGTVAIIGGGATGASVAINLAARHPEKSVHYFFSEDAPLPGYHPQVRASVLAKLAEAGVDFHPGHRAEIPPGFQCDEITSAPVRWSTGQPPFSADAVLWAVGRMIPNNDFIPAQMLDDCGFVRTDDYLRVPGYDNIFAVGDIAASDIHRSSARNWGYRLLGHNLRATLRGKPGAMKRYAPPEHRWGSVYGVQDDGLRVFQPDGGSFRFPRWSIDTLLFPLAVRRGIYKGMRALD